jgi:asparagine synthase (glutamine-hydrolysing)
MRFVKFYSESQKLKNNRSVGIANEIGRAAFYYMPEFAKRKIRSSARSGSSFISENFQKVFADVTDSRNMGTSYLEMSLQYTKYGMHDLLRYEDRNSMAFSIESRVPFLDHRLVEFTLALPDDAKMQNGWTKFILRKTLDKKVPDEITWRTDKKGFVTPQKNWMQEIGKPLRDYITSSNIPTILNRKNILAALDSPTLNAAQVSEFWKAVSVIKWAEVFKVSE